MRGANGVIAAEDQRRDRPPCSREREPLLCPVTARGLVRRMFTHPSAEPNELEMIQGTHAVLDLLSGRWSVDVLYLLASGTRRYSAIFYEVGEISKKTLTQTLRTLEANGLVLRTAYAEVPVRVEYSLSGLGWSITQLLMAMYEWSAEHAPQQRRAQLKLAA
jgi:DNA-binding HxlR family transcriptional regulator